MNHSTLVGAVGSSNMCQGTQEESHSPVYPGISRQTSVQDGTNRAANLLQPLSRGQEKAWRIHWADTHSQERNFRSPAYLRKDSSTSLKERESECSQDNKNFTNTSLPPSPPPHGNTARGWPIRQRWILLQEKRRVVSDQGCRTQLKKLVSLQQNQEDQGRTSMTGRREEIGKRTGKTVKGH